MNIFRINLTGTLSKGEKLVNRMLVIEEYKV